MKTKSYRMEVNAFLCFSVKAKTRPGAIKAAKQLTTNVIEGLSVPYGDDDEDNDLRIYIDDEAGPEVIDIEEPDETNS